MNNNINTMKKLFFAVIIALFSLTASAQYQAISNGESGLSVRTKINTMNQQLYNLNLTGQFSDDGVTWDTTWTAGDNFVRFSKNLGSTWSDAVPIWDGSSLTKLTLDTLIIGTDTVISFGGGYVALADSNDVYTTPAYVDSVAGAAASSRTVYTITLPTSTTVAGRVSGAVEGTDYPTGWTIAAGTSAVDLAVTHGLGRRVASVTVWALTGTEERQLFGNAAYSGVTTPTVNSLLIESLATIQKTISIYIVFENE